MIFTARQLQEQCQEQNKDLYMTFVYLTKTFNIVMMDTGKPWPSLIPSNGAAIVYNDGEFSEPFKVTNGVKQGCVMAPTLFSMMFSAMIM